MAKLSYWERDTFFSGIDFLVIGSGIVGLNAAIRLKELHPKQRVVVLERGILPIGASTRNAGFACFGSMTELLDDLETHSESEVFALVQKRWKGLLRLRERVGDRQMDYEGKGGFELFEKAEKEVFEKCMDYQTYFNNNLKSITGIKEVFRRDDNKLKDSGFSKDIQYLIWNAGEGQIHTGKMMHGLLNLAKKKGVEIFNGVEVERLETSDNKVTVQLKSGFDLEATKVIVATNGFARSLLPELEVVPARNQVIITKPIKGLKLEGCFHYDKGYVYFRNVEDRILLGGFRNLHREEETTDAFEQTLPIQSALEQFLENKLLPNQNVEIDMRWSGILGVGASKKPILEKLKNNIFVAVRLGGMGVAIGSLLGEEVAEMAW